MFTISSVKLSKVASPKESLSLRFREMGIVVVVIVVFLISALSAPSFLSLDNLINILLYIPLLVVVAMGEMMVIISRNIDLSVGSILGFSGIVIGLLFMRDPAFPIWLAALTSVLIGAVLGAVNGLLVSWLRLPAIIVTLGTLSAYRGLLFMISGGIQIDPNYIPRSLTQLSAISSPWIVAFAILVAIVTALFLRYFRMGREIYAIGSNAGAARLRGLNVDRIVLIIFTVSGGAAGIAGLMYASLFGYVNPAQTGNGFELIVISATVIGGTSVFGGTGTVPGTVLGCLLLGILNVSLSVLGVAATWQHAVYGMAILLALSVDKTIQNRLFSGVRRGEIR